LLLSCELLSSCGSIVNYKEEIMVRTVRNPETPFVSALDTDWIQKITIIGKAPTGAKRFSIYLQNGSEYEPDEVAFHLDFRFNHSDIRKIVTNHRKEGAWQSEKNRDCEFPLNEDEDFKIKILVKKDSFKVKVNGEHLLEYEQKLSCKTINCIRIDKDIQLYKVKMA